MPLIHRSSGMGIGNQLMESSFGPVHGVNLLSPRSSPTSDTEKPKADVLGCHRRIYYLLPKYNTLLIPSGDIGVVE